MAEGNHISSHKVSQGALTMAALGIVFGDIGTSPLYAVREAFHGPHAIPISVENIFGVLSLIVWSLILVISIKYLGFILRADNKGEGGVLALTALASPPHFVSKFKWNRILLYLGLFGSALLFGDGVITPAITVLGAVEGLKVLTPVFEPYVVPATIIILTGIFSVQSHGTAKIGAIFGPVILLWFITLGSLGIYGIFKHPNILEALNPMYAVDYFAQNGFDGLIVLGAVFLVVTGGEALYADMGHFGKSPIRKAWFFVALPGLLLNYFGQGALILTDPSAAENPFYFLAPSWALIGVLIIATMASIIASQALISGVFSLTRQAVHLGYFPRVRIIHTSGHEIGQIYIPPINWLLYLLTVGIVIGFKSSSALASAYGIAVSLTMVITTILACSVAYQRWRWNPVLVTVEIIVFLSIEIVFLTANFSKIADGGWFPLVLGALVFILMTTWKKGRKILASNLAEQTIPLETFLQNSEIQELVRVSGTAIFMSGTSDGTPVSLLKNVKHNQSLHERNIILTVVTDEVPYVKSSDRVEIKEVRPKFFKVIARYGFMENPDISDVLKCCEEMKLIINLEESTFYLGRETLIPSNKKGFMVWRARLFSIMSRNSERPTAYFNIPPERVVEVGIQVEI